MLTYKVKFDQSYWLDFAENKLIDSIVSFVRVNPEIWDNTCCREIEKFNDMIRPLDSNSSDYYNFVSLYGGGAFDQNNTFVNLYCSYVKEQFKNLPTIEELYTEGDTFNLFYKLEALVKDEKNANASLWVVAIRLVKGLTLNGVNQHNAKRFMELISSSYFTVDKKVLIYNMFMKNERINQMLNVLITYEPSYSKWVKDTIASTLTEK
jgi:hypothetical protein